MPSLIEHLAFHARLRPAATALLRTDHRVSYGELIILVRRAARKLRAAGIRPGEVVVTCLPGKYPDWIISLALAHEGAVSCANFGDSPLDASPDCRWVLCGFG